MPLPFPRRLDNAVEKALPAATPTQLESIHTHTQKPQSDRDLDLGRDFFFTFLPNRARIFPSFIEGRTVSQFSRIPPHNQSL